MSKAMLRRFDLFLMDRNCKPASQNVIDEVLEEYDLLEEGSVLPEAMKKRLLARGDMLDYQKNLLMIAKTPRGQSMAFEEMEILRPIVLKIKYAKLGGSILLEESEWKELCVRAKKPIITQYNELWFEFLHALMNCKQVPVEEAE